MFCVNWTFFQTHIYINRFYCVKITSWLWHHILVFTRLACRSQLIPSADRGAFFGHFLLFPAALACWKLVALPASSQQGSLVFCLGCLHFCHQTQESRLPCLLAHLLHKNKASMPWKGALPSSSGDVIWSQTLAHEPAHLSATVSLPDHY